MKSNIIPFNSVNVCYICAIFIGSNTGGTCLRKKCHVMTISTLQTLPGTLVDP